MKDHMVYTYTAVVDAAKGLPKIVLRFKLESQLGHILAKI